MKITITLLFVLIANCAIAQSITIATYQYADNPRIKNLEPLANHLQERMGIKTQVKSYPTIQLFIEAIQQGEVDVAFINTFGYLLLETSHKKHVMVPSLVMQGPDTVKADYKTAFVAAATSPVKTWKDVKTYAGQTHLALVFTGSTAGNLVPRLGLTALNINDAEQYFKKVSYAGTHANALQYLLKDSADLAAMGSAELEKLSPQEKSQLRVIWTSPEIPLGPALINTKLNKELQRKITEELINLDKTNNLAFSGLKSAWSEAKTTTHFIAISKNYYQPFLQHFGATKYVNAILQQFAN
ncbi:phosphate/phosphite/phosphonate ABC transporter substrate-binding protein [Chitinophaga sp. MM2321]|uniref:phosphate/phosphite/phosphonate ABC transporter substrate-binding protein n=1 Tax=Chitinophaga sp. MM2321 TaxID=3137178 RepID=UPI0032D5A932